MKLAPFVVTTVSAIACIVVACSSDGEDAPREPATCVFPDGTRKREGADFACPGFEQDYPCTRCSCNADGTIGSSSYASNCYGQPSYPAADAGTDPGARDGAADSAADANADANGDASADGDADAG
jgi:hypothetical protein